MIKRPGKTKFSGRRRTATRKAGFVSHPNSTGGELKTVDVDVYKLKANTPLSIQFIIPKPTKGEFAAFGGYFLAASSTQVSIDADGVSKFTLTPADAPNWSKFGSIWESLGEKEIVASITFLSAKDSSISFYDLKCGIVEHEYIKDARPILLKNLYTISPETNFITKTGKLISDLGASMGKEKIYLKSCNRCARFLPVNIPDDRVTLSFSNHCVAAHRRPCKHGGFGRLKKVGTDEIVQLDHGFQLECRFCKKFVVNAPLNPQRNAAQMKEDGTRRRAFELLLMHLNGGSDQLLYRHKTGRELTDDIWKKFGGVCFNCNSKIENSKKMHLDHTRPLALLWPLDETATCLCGNCNSSKRDRSPADFYKEKGKLEALSKITGIPLAELKAPGPNLAAIKLLQDRFDWFFDEFCAHPDLLKERDGKIPLDLVFKALQKALNSYPDGAPYDLLEELKLRKKPKS